MLRSDKWVLPSDARFRHVAVLNQAAGRSHPNEASIVECSSSSSSSLIVSLSPILRRCCRRLCVSQRLVHSTGTPQPVQQHSKLPCHCHDGSLLGVLAAADSD